ncbi:MAG TPA: RDD family protein, partial [Acidimicrobiales bacterium]|nr:RDD family protein [Acidimicrobiales bacterium]
ASRVVNLVLEAIDVDAIVSKVDVDALIQRVDVDAIVSKVDVGKIIERVDVDAIVQRVDVDAIVRRVDVNAIISELDIDSLVEKTELGSIIAKSTTGIFTEVLDVIRAQGVGLDDFCARWTNRALRRPPESLPVGPGTAAIVRSREVTARDGMPAATEGPAELLGPAAPPPELTVERQGQYAGAVSRLAAFAIDIGASWGLYVGFFALVGFFVQLVSSKTFTLTHHEFLAVTALAVWEFVYFAYQWAVAGRTIGMAVLGIRVVDAASGAPISAKEAAIRTLTLPLSILVLLLGCLGILTNRQRQGWHDRFAGTAVVYAWDARAARLRWLAERDTPAIGGARP